MTKGWHGNSMGHSMASKGITVRTSNKDMFYELENKDPDTIKELISIFRNKIDNTDKLTKGYCVEFAKALSDIVGGGENYQIMGHNYLHYNDYFYDGTGVYTKQQIEGKYKGAKLKPDPDRWNYIYNMNVLNTYRKIFVDSYEQQQRDRRMIQ